MLGNWNDNGCYYNRAVLPARYCYKDAEKNGVRIHLTRAITSDNLNDFDVYIVHGMDAALGNNLQAISYWKMQNKKFIWSIDDDYFNVPAWNAAKPNQLMMGGLINVLGMADEIWCSTEFLKSRIAPHVSVPIRVLPNLIDLRVYRTPSRKRWKKAEILWAGTATHSKDIVPLCDGITDLFRRAKGVYRDRARVTFFGMSPTQKVEQDHLWGDVNFIPYVPFNEYHRTVTSLAGDIGVCPLQDDLFNRSKSNLKILEMASMWMPVVASKVGPYDAEFPGVKLVTDGKSWANALAEWIDDETQRGQDAANAYNHVQEKWNWENAENRAAWTDAFCSLSEVK